MFAHLYFPQYSSLINLLYLDRLPVQFNHFAHEARPNGALRIGPEGLSDETQDEGALADARIPQEDELDFPGAGRHGARKNGVA